MLDKIKIPDQKLASFMSLVTSQPELKVIAATMHKDAPIFKAHNIIDERWKMNHIYWCKLIELPAKKLTFYSTNAILVENKR